MRRSLAAVLAVTLGVAACAAPSQPYLDIAQQQCAKGDQRACDGVPFLQADVAREHNEQAGQVALGILAVLGAAAAGAAAGYAASHPVYTSPEVIVVCRWGC
jgi:hypothetical protein